MPDETKAEKEHLDELAKMLNEGVPEESLGMDVHVAAPVPVSVAKVKALIKKNPDHPNSKVFEKAVGKNADSHIVYIDKVDLQAVMDNKEVIIKHGTVETDLGLTRELRKELGDTPKPPDEKSAQPEAKPEHRGPQSHTPVTTENQQAKNRRVSEPVEQPPR